MEKIQKIVVTGFLYQSGKVLILKRSEKEKFLPGLFELAGGKVEFGEDLSSALVREYKEETNLEIEVIRPYRTFTYISDDGFRQTIEIVYTIKILNNSPMEIKLSDSHTDFKWATLQEVVSEKLTSDETAESIKSGFLFSE